MTTTFAMVGKGTAAMSFTMAYIVAAEVYPTEVRNWGMGTSSVCARISGMAAPYIGDSLVKFLQYDYWFGYKMCLAVVTVLNRYTTYVP